MKKYNEARKTLKTCTQDLLKEDSIYLTSCYQGIIKQYFKDRQKKLEKAAKISLKLVSFGK